MHETLSQYSPKELARWRVLSIAFALLAFSIGGAAFFGWLLDNEFLKRIHPALVTMKANTAVCLMLVAISILLIQDPATSTTRRRISQVCAAIVAFVGLLTLTEHIVGWDLHIDQLLFVETQLEAGLSFAGRMGVAASLNFTLLGIALALIDARSQRWWRVSNVAGFVVIAITLLVFLYYFGCRGHGPGDRSGFFAARV
jgi:4-amino-4-deoxy-L-arabinose transferase-like glycosyltransferase